jgi:hypothetical protein
MSRIFQQTETCVVKPNPAVPSSTPSYSRSAMDKLQELVSCLLTTSLLMIMDCCYVLPIDRG